MIGKGKADFGKDQEGLDKEFQGNGKFVYIDRSCPPGDDNRFLSSLPFACTHIGQLSGGYSINFLHRYPCTPAKINPAASMTAGSSTRVMNSDASKLSLTSSTATLVVSRVMRKAPPPGRGRQVILLNPVKPLPGVGTGK
jgi:hypothetical protein